MKLRMLVVGVLALGLAAPALAVETSYILKGDNSTKFPTDGTILRPGAIVTGLAVLDDLGATTELDSLTYTADFVDIVGATVTTGVPGATVALDTATTVTVSGPQTGTGNTSTSITWGGLTGFTQTGYLICVTECGGCPTSACTTFGVAEGIGPPAPLNGSTFDPGPFTFTGSTFEGVAFQQVNLGGGAVLADTLLRGEEGTVPLLPLAAFGGLGAGLVFLGSRALRRKDG